MTATEFYAVNHDGSRTFQGTLWQEMAMIPYAKGPYPGQFEAHAFSWSHFSRYPLSTWNRRPKANK